MVVHVVEVSAIELNDWVLFFWWPILLLHQIHHILFTICIFDNWNFALLHHFLSVSFDTFLILLLILNLLLLNRSLLFQLIEKLHQLSVILLLTLFLNRWLSMEVLNQVKLIYIFHFCWSIWYFRRLVGITDILFVLHDISYPGLLIHHNLIEHLHAARCIFRLLTFDRTIVCLCTSKVWVSDFWFAISQIRKVLSRCVFIFFWIYNWAFWAI